jgi:hypothetical protein
MRVTISGEEQSLATPEFMVDSRWYQETTFAGYQKLMRSFLTGELESTPWHLAPLELESELIFAPLLELNSHGFLTTNSQPGMRKLIRGGFYRQRAWVEGLCAPETAEKLQMRLGDVDGLQVAVAPHSDLQEGFNPYTLPVTKWMGRASTWHGDGFVIPHTSLLDEAPYSSATWELLTSLNTVAVVDLKWGSQRIWKLLEDLLEGDK